MKKTILFFVLFMSFIANAQQDDNPKTQKKSIDFRKHELKFGAIKLLAGAVLELTYEHIQTKDFTYGSSILINFDSNNGYNETFSVTPFARFYFQETKEYGAYGFFVEGFAKVVTGNHRELISNVQKNYTSGGFGISVGKKWVNNSGFVMEVLIGGARGFGDGSSAPSGYFRGDVNIGYRFN